MPCVAAALITDDDFVAFGEQVYELAFGLIAPLQPDHASNAHDYEPLHGQSEQDARIYRGALSKPGILRLVDKGGQGRPDAHKPRVTPSSVWSRALRCRRYPGLHETDA